MSFREINHKNNEEYWERLELVMERIEAVSEEEASSVEELYRGYFFEMSELFLVLYKLAEASLSGKLAEISTLEGKKINRRLYLDVQEDYADSYANPAYAVSKMTGIAVGVVCGIPDTNISMVIFAVVFALLLNKIGSRSTVSTDTIISVFSSCSVAIGLAILPQTLS